MILLTREKFKELCFKRSLGKCVFCKAPAVDAHHILDRKLFPDGGYYLNNSAAVCESCHIKCEKSIYTVEQVREACGITEKVLPPGLSPDRVYDKWGEPVMYGLNNRIHYPRTYHLPWSPGLQNDDRRVESLDSFTGKSVIVTEKMDGENTTMYRDCIHARALDVVMTHPSRAWVRALHGSIAHDIPEGWRICGENIYAKHSIEYDKLPSFFMVFSIWNEKNECLSWQDTVEWCKLLGLQTVPVLDTQINAETFFKLLSDPEWHQEWWECRQIGRELSGGPEWHLKDAEGYVIRNADSFPFEKFSENVVKYVRKNHIQPGTEHWTRGVFTPNKLA